MLAAVSKLRIGSGVSMIESAASVFLSLSTDFMRALRARMSQIESPPSLLPLSAKAGLAKTAAPPRAAAEARSLRRVRSMQSPVEQEQSQKYHSPAGGHNAGQGAVKPSGWRSMLRWYGKQAARRASNGVCGANKKRRPLGPAFASPMWPRCHISPGAPPWSRRALHGIGWMDQSL